MTATCGNSNLRRAWGQALFRGQAPSRLEIAQPSVLDLDFDLDVDLEVVGSRHAPINGVLLHDMSGEFTRMRPFTFTSRPRFRFNLQARLFDGISEFRDRN